ncbi:MAG: small, acid-soluble spore protein, alpha/beta type, partial [Bacillota bacterium]
MAGGRRVRRPGTSAGHGGRKRTKHRTRHRKKGPYDDLKIEVARELGLMGKVRRQGWAELTAAESGRIGGI